MILAAATAWALYSVLLKRWPGNLSINGRLAAISFAGVIVLLPFLGWEMVAVGTATPDARTLAIIAILILVPGVGAYATHRSEEHTSELQSLMRISYAVFCLKKK